MTTMAHNDRAASQANWNEVNQHEVPDWFHDAKLGIFLHWGLYSVPAWAPRVEHINAIIAKSGAQGLYRANPYAEWYRNSYRVPNSPSESHHLATYGTRDYYDFATEFNEAAAAADLDALAASLRDIGAEYVVLTSKHHDGFTLWPSEVPHPNAAAVSPRRQLQAERDLVGELSDAVRSAGMHMGLYYSGGYDWSVHDVVMTHLADAVLGIPPQADYERYASAHVRELTERYRPSVLWNDIGWPGGGDLAALFSDYYAQVPDGVVNDRWTESPPRRGKLISAMFGVGGRLVEALWPLVPASLKKVGFPTPKHADFTTPEYQTFDEVQTHKWEQTRGIGHSFSYNQNEHPDDLLGVEELIHGFVDVVSKNGNLLLGVGPRADGSIPNEQQLVLDGLGEWMRINGAAIKGTRPWHIAEGRTDQGIAVRYTQSKDAKTVNVILLDRAPISGQHILEEFLTSVPAARVELLGVGEVPHQVVEGRLAVTLPDGLPESPAHSLQVSLAEPPTR